MMLIISICQLLAIFTSALPIRTQCTPHTTVVCSRIYSSFTFITTIYVNQANVVMGDYCIEYKSIHATSHLRYLSILHVLHTYHSTHCWIVFANYEVINIGFISSFSAPPSLRRELFGFSRLSLFARGGRATP